MNVMRQKLKDMLQHSPNGSEHTFPQTTEDLSIEDVVIPKGFINISRMCETQGSNIKQFFKSKACNDYLDAIAYEFRDVYDVDISQEKWINTNILIRAYRTPHEGIWAHPVFAIRIAIWISPNFGVWLTNALLKNS